MAKSAKERRLSSRAELKKAGGKQVNVVLSPDGFAALERLYAWSILGLKKRRPRTQIIQDLIIEADRRHVEEFGDRTYGLRGPFISGREHRRRLEAIKKNARNR